jgi:5-bromo-4-chloroindolyl phosphate hydrolysis protein
VSGGNSGTTYTSFFSYNNTGLLSKKEYNHPLSPASRSLVEEYAYDSADNQIKATYDYTKITSQPIKYTISTAIDHANRIKGEYFD